MTSPDNLSAWKDGLLRDLLVRTRAHFRGGGGDGSAAEDSAYKAKVLQSAVEDESQRAELTAIIDGVDPRLFTQLTPRQTARHVRLVGAALAQPPHVALEVRCYPLKGHSELAVVAPDAPGVLAAIAGALTANRVDVLGAVLGHVDLRRSDSGRLVTDVFYVRDLKGEAIPEDDIRWKRLATDLKDLLAGDKPDSDKVASLIVRRRPKSTMPKRVTPGVITDIKLHDDSTQATIVEVSTRDRVGVLYAITHTLAELGLDISLAKVATEGEKVNDTFYVTRRGERITDSVERAVILQRLRMAVDAAGLTGS